VTDQPTEPHPPAPGRPRLSVVVPAYGEEHRIAMTIRRLRSELGDVVGPGGLEIVVVDDGSLDGTTEAARGAGADHVIAFPHNKGKGAAVRAGVMKSTGSTVTFTDADLAYAPHQLVPLLDEIEKGWDVAVGTRHSRGAATSGVRTVGHRVFNAATRLVLRRRFADTQCGCKGFHGDAARRLFARTRVDGFAFDVEVLWLAGYLGLTVEEVPVELDRAEGSTVRFSVDALRMLRDLVRLRWRITIGAYRRPD
jgi:dolichyl-phosphate beta-glucosyltransferase